MKRARTFGLFLLLATLLVFLPATRNQFVNFDDPDYVAENSVVNQGLSWMGLKWAFVSAHAANWHPLTWLSHMLDCDLFRLNPAGHHLVNVLFHAANAALLFFLILRLTNPPLAAKAAGCEPPDVWPAAFVAALFAWHPLHVESVAWVAERKDVLSTFFSFLSLMCYARYARGRGLEGAGANPWVIQAVRRDYGLALICFVLALLSKPMPVTLPLVMLLVDFWPLNRWGAGQATPAVIKNLVLEKAPFFVVSGIVCGITVLTQQHAESSFANVPLGLRLENVVAAYVFYLGKLLWPLHLAVFYSYRPAIPPLFLLESGLLLTLISALAWRSRRDHPYLLVGWLWFVVTLVPVIGLIQVGSQSAADRYTYFPSIGIFLAGVFLVQALARHSRLLAVSLPVLGGAVLLACVGLTERQVGYWRDSETLFRHAIAVEDSVTARIDLGSALQEKKELEAALTQYIIAWRLHPDSPIANIDMGQVLADKGNLQLSALYFQRAARENPWNLIFFDNYGRELVTLKRYPEAQAAFASAMKIDPKAATPHFLMARLLLQEGHNQAGLAELDQAVKLEPQNLQNVIFAAAVLASCDDPKIRNGARAKKLAAAAVAATHNQQAAALDVLAMSSAELGRYADALVYEQKAIQLAGAASQPDGLDLLREHLARYQKHQPWRESFATN